MWQLVFHPLARASPVAVWRDLVASYVGCFGAPSACQQQEAHEMAIRCGRRFRDGPEDADLVISEDAVTRGLAFLHPTHAPANRREEVVVPACMPVHDFGKVRQHKMGHARPTLVLDLVQEPDDLGALDGIDLAGTERRENQPLKS